MIASASKAFFRVEVGKLDDAVRLSRAPVAIFSIELSKDELERLVEPVLDPTVEPDGKGTERPDSSAMSLSVVNRIEVKSFEREATFIGSTLESSSIVEIALPAAAIRKIEEMGLELISEVRVDAKSCARLRPIEPRPLSR